MMQLFERRNFTKSQGIVFALLTSTLLVCLPQMVQAQDMVVMKTPQGEAYVYVDYLSELGQGFHVYRQHDGTEEHLTPDGPVFQADNASEFRRMVGNRYDQLRGALDAETQEEVYFQLRGDEFNRTMLAFSYPEIAKAFGQLFIDENPLPGEQVTYRFEWVNRRGEAVGREAEVEAIAELPNLHIPGVLDFERRGNRGHISWRYDETDRPDDYVIRFDIYIRPKGEEDYTKVNRNSVLRQADVEEFSASFPVRIQADEAEIVVEAIDITSYNRIRSAPEVISLEDMRQPSSISRIFSSFEDGVVELSWAVSPESFVAGYHIDRFNVENEEWERLTDELIDAGNPVYTDNTIEPGYHFQYYAVAVSETGVESEYGNPAIENVIEVVYPDPPSELAARYNENEGTIELNWTPAEEDELFNTYVILRREYTEEGERAFGQANDGRVTGSGFTDQGQVGEGFTEGQFYEFGVASANRQGLRSDTVFTVIQVPNLTPPDPPGNLRADQDDGERVRLRWAASGSGDVTSYNVYRVDSEQDTVASETARSQRYLTDREVIRGQTYSYFVTAVDSSGNESEAGGPAEIELRDTTPPASIRNLQVVAGEDGVMLRWEESASNDAAGYLVERAEVRSGQFERLTEQPLEQPEWMDAEGGRGLWYRIITIDESGNKSRPSTPRQATPGR